MVIAVILMTVFNSLGGQQEAVNGLSYTEFMTEVKKRRVENVKLDGREIHGQLISGEFFTTSSP